MMKQVTFVKAGYDPFIDFLKAYAIICVLIGHTIPHTDAWGYFFWAGMQVPLFILIQTFHFYKKDSKLNVGKLLKRILIPFVVVGCFTFFMNLVFGKSNANALAIRWIRNGGGAGPGSYYPLVYIQIALLLVCFKTLFLRYSKQTLLLVFLAISEACEITCSFLNVPEPLYRLMAIRYMFLLYLGWLWVKDGVKVNRQIIVLCILSFLTIVYFQYFSKTINNEPWFFNTVWRTHRWPCYFYVSHGLVLILYYIWKEIQEYEWICNVVKKLASASYEIFLVQMAVIALFKTDALPIVENTYIKFAIWLVIVWSISIYGGMYFHKFYKKFVLN